MIYLLWKKGLLIRGVMQGDIRDIGALKDFAARNKIAIYESHMVHNPYGGPHKTFLQGGRQGNWASGIST